MDVEEEQSGESKEVEEIELGDTCLFHEADDITME